jgi:CheY-like chemotaxis protein
MRSKKPILLVEDDSIDVMTVKRALKEINVANKLVTAANGEEALAYLRDEKNEKPCIMLLDLNMPKMNGLEFLSEIKKDEVLKKIPAIILTTSKEDHDRLKSFSLSAAGYMIKPVDFRQFVDVMRAINMYWTISELP